MRALLICIVFLAFSFFLMVDVNHFAMIEKKRLSHSGKPKNNTKDLDDEDSTNFFLQEKLKTEGDDGSVHMVFVEKENGVFVTRFNNLYEKFILKIKNGEEIDYVDDYEVISFLGATNVGKSTFSNEFFGTDFKVMDANSLGRKLPTTYGIDTMLLKIQKFLLVDTQGLNSDELKTEEERRIDKKTMLFSFLIGQTSWFHINENEVAESILYSLIEPLFFSYLNITAPGKRSDLHYLFRKRKLVFFVHRMDNENFFKSNDTRNQVLSTLEKAFNEAKKEEDLKISDFFDIEVHYFHHYLFQKKEYLEDMAKFKKHFLSQSKTRKEKYSVKLSEILYSSGNLWKMVINDKYVTGPAVKHSMSYECLDTHLEQFIQNKKHIAEVKSPKQLELELRDLWENMGCRINRLKEEEVDRKIGHLQKAISEIVSNSGDCLLFDLVFIFLFMSAIAIPTFIFTSWCGCLDRWCFVPCSILFYLFIFLFWLCIFGVVFVNLIHIIGFYFGKIFIEIRYMFGRDLWIPVLKIDKELLQVNPSFAFFRLIIKQFSESISSPTFFLVNSMLALEKEKNFYSSLIEWYLGSDGDVRNEVLIFFAPVICFLVIFLVVYCCISRYYSTKKIHWGDFTVSINISGKSKKGVENEIRKGLNIGRDNDLEWWTKNWWGKRNEAKFSDVKNSWRSDYLVSINGQFGKETKKKKEKKKKRKRKKKKIKRK